MQQQENRRESYDAGREREHLVLSKLGLVHSIVRKFINNATTPLYQELYSEGVAGLVEAAKRYLPEKAKFTTFAYYRIQGAILNYLQSKAPMIRVPRGNNRTGAGTTPVVLSLAGSDMQEMEILHKDDGFAFVDLIELIRQALSESEYKILMLKYNGYSQAEIGQYLGKSDAAISKIVVGIRRKLRPILTNKGVE